MTSWDVAVVGGGHNGLIAAGLLAKRGLRTILFERRGVVGGAAVTEHPWGPDFKVSSLSYVISLMPPTVLRELELERHGYKVYPQHGYFAPYRDGRYLMLPGDLARKRSEVARFSERDARALFEWDAFLTRMGRLLGPLLTVVPPRMGSKRARDLVELAGLAWKLKGWTQRDTADVARLFTSSLADLLEDRFESPQLLGALSISGVIGTWAGPRSPGTAYVMAHHKIGDVGDGQMGSWGFPEGGMGGATAAMRRAAEALGAAVRTEASVARLLVERDHVQGVVLESGEECRAAMVLTTVHPKIAFLQHLDPGVLPPDFTEAVRSWKTRSGTVKVNLAVDRLPEFASRPGFDPEVHGGTILLAESLDEVEQAFQDAVAGQPARRPMADVCIPSVFDATLAPPGKHIVSMFTQWVPCTFADRPDRPALEAYADRLVERMEEVAPGFTSSILHRQVIGPHEMQAEYSLLGGNIFHGELSLNQLFWMRPAPGWADFRTPMPGLYHASSATHGGGGVTGIPALQAVKQILSDARAGLNRRTAGRRSG